MYQVKQSTTAYPLVFLMVDSTDHVTGKTGLSPTVTLRKPGGSFASPAGAVTEIANGWYQVAGNATDSNTLGPLILHATGTAADPVDTLYEVVATDPQTTIGAQVLDQTVVGHVTSGTVGEYMVTIQQSQTNQLDSIVNDIADVPGLVWNELAASHIVDGSMGSYMNALVLTSGDTVTATSTTIRLDTTASATNLIHDGCWVVITSGTGVGQARYITQYVGSSRTCTVTPAWTTTPDVNSKYAVLPGAYIQAVYGAVGSVTGSVGGSVALVTALDTQAKADVNAEVLDVMNTDTYAEPGQGSPSATTSIFAKINYLYKAWRNKSTQDATDYKLYNDNAVTVDQKATTSNDGTTFTRGEIQTGP